MKFSDIPGQESLKNSLREYADSGKMPHALLIAGPSGAGKMLAARAFVQYIHCEDPQGGEPCGHCQACRLHAELSHPDLHFIFPIVKGKQKAEVSADLADRFLEMLRRYPMMPEERWLELIDAGNTQPKIYVREADDIVRADSYPAYTSRYKVFLIWLPERMMPETANKLLKVIEEPSPGTLFLLVSNNELQILPTIYSRVQRLHAGENRLEGDDLAADSEETPEFREMFQELMRSAYSIKPAKLKQLADKVAGFGREKIRRFLNYVNSQVRENFIYNLQHPELNRLSPEEEAFSRRFSPFINHMNVEDFMAETDRARIDVERNANAKLVLFDYFLIVITLLRRK